MYKQQRQTKNPNMDSNQSNAFHVWKEKPPGPEQKELEKLMKSQDFDPSISADNMRKSNALFQRVSSQVFSSHYRNTKAKLGLCAAVSAESGGAGPSGISELGGALNLSRRLADSPEPDVDDDHTDGTGIRFKNPPFWTWTYFDHQKNMDFVCVAAVMMSGSRNVNFVMSEDGTRITIKYTWPTAIYKANELFEKAKRNGQKLSIQDPKVHCFVANALQRGVTSNSSPQGEITIDLPQRVQRHTSTWKKEGFQVDQSSILMLEFSAYEKDLVIDDADTSINFV